MAHPHGVVFGVSDDAQLGDAILELRQGPFEREPSVAIFTDPQVVGLALRVRALEIAVLALQARTPAARWSRYKAHWRTRLAELDHWIRQHLQQLWESRPWR